MPLMDATLHQRNAAVPRAGASIVVPFYNEEAILEWTLQELLHFHEKSGGDVEFVLSDDGSTDGGAALARRAAEKHPDAFRYVRSEVNRGKGHALTLGLGAAVGEILGFIDADLEIPPEDLRHGLDRMRATGEAVLIGTKVAVVANRIRARHRGLASFFYNGLVDWVLGSHLPDHQCGLKLFRRAAWESVGREMTERGWAWDTEFLLRLQKKGYAIGIFAVKLLRKRQSTVDFLPACAAMFAAVLRLRRRGLRL